MDIKLSEHGQKNGLDLTQPKKCALFLFGTMIVYMAMSRLVSLVVTVSINLLSILSFSASTGVDFSQLLLAFQSTLFDGLEVFEELRLLISTLISSFFTLYLAVTVSGVKPRYVFSSKKVPVPAAVAAVCICVGFSFIGSWVGSMIEMAANSFGVKFYSEYLMPPVGSIPAMVMFFLSLVVIPAVFEECLVRGLVLHTLRRFGAIFCVLASSLIFALMHSSLTSMIQALFFSLAAGYMVMRFENVWITVIAHFIVNLLSFITNTVMQLQPSAVYADFLQAVTGVVFLLFIGACIYSVIFHRQMFTSGYNLTDRPAARAFLLSPVALCFYIICVLAIVLNTFTTL